MPDRDLRSLPKAVLHDHLDGGLRVETVIELAEAAGYEGLPTSDPSELARFFNQEDAADLVEYLEAFEHTVGVLQTPEALERAAYECALDHHADGVVYAEVRFGPSLHLSNGMKREDAIEAVLAGMSRGARETGLLWGVIATAMRHGDYALEDARAAARFAGDGVVAFDLEGPEEGFPADDHLAACRLARESGLGLTIHAGEHDGPESIWRAVGRCGARRIGHGARLIEDCRVERGDVSQLGGLARTLRDHRITLEICITSNVHTKIVADAADHPIGALYRAGLRVTLNTDNRLMSSTNMTKEVGIAVDHHGMTIADLGMITEATIEDGFGDWSERRRLIRDVVRPAYAEAAASIQDRM